MILFYAGAALSATMREEPQKVLMRVQKGTYKVLQKIGQDTIPKEIGTEAFTKSYYNNNTIVLESSVELDYQFTGSLSSKFKTITQLEIEGETSFPRRYEMRKEIKGADQKLTVEMFANIAVITFQMNAQEEKSKYVIPTGALFIESNLIHQYALLLNRYVSNVPGTQNVTIFNPSSRRVESATIEYVGEHMIYIDGESKKIKLYKIGIKKIPEMRLYVNEDGIIVKADNGVQQYTLLGFEEEEMQAPAEG